VRTSNPTQITSSVLLQFIKRLSLVKCSIARQRNIQHKILINRRERSQSVPEQTNSAYIELIEFWSPHNFKGWWLSRKLDFQPENLLKKLRSYEYRLNYYQSFNGNISLTDGKFKNFYALSKIRKFDHHF
jgi:hypothetical protein